MKFPFVPDYYFPDIYAIDPERLRARGVRVLLADLDNTLAPYGVPTPSQDVVAWRARLEQAGITLFLLSNSRRPGRAPSVMRRDARQPSVMRPGGRRKRRENAPESTGLRKFPCKSPQGIVK